MHFIQVPEAISIKNFLTGKPMLDEKGEPSTKTFAEHIYNTVLSDTRFATTPVQFVELRKLAESLGDLKPGDYWEVEDDPWRRAKKIIEEPAIRYQSAIVEAQVEPFGRAFIEAPTDDPRKAAKPAEPVAAPATPTS